MRQRLSTTPIGAIALAFAWSAMAQTGGGHASHHPSVATPGAAPQAAMGAREPVQMVGSPPTSVTGGMGVMGEMGKMMREMGTPPTKELYPTLMELPDLPFEQRLEIQTRAHERMEKGRQALAEAVAELTSAALREDYAAMQGLADRLREAIAQFDSGLAAHRALAEGKAPRTIALTWFKREMNLSPSVTLSNQPHGLFGLSAFHYVTMFAVATFAVLLVAMFVSRQRRAAALAKQLLSTPKVAPAATPTHQSSTVGGWSGALRVANIFQETADVKTFRFGPVSGETLPFSFEPGQFLTLAIKIDGQPLKRSYSIASSPCCHGWCEITVKKNKGGTVSGYLHEHVRVGDVLDASGPYGRFTFRGREAPNVVLIAGGVGITPMMSSIRYLTDQSWTGQIYLIYAAPRLDAVIFQEEFNYLTKRHSNLHITLVLSDEPAQHWGGPRGYITGELLSKLIPEITTHRIHLCGPPAMMDAVKRELAALAFPVVQLHTELFLAPEVKKPDFPVASEQKVQCRLAHSGKTVALSSNQTVLEAAEAAGVALEYSCRQGFCGVCKARLLEGNVTMEIEDGLAPADKTAGYILTCQAKAEHDIVVDV